MAARKSRSTRSTRTLSKARTDLLRETEPVCSRDFVDVVDRKLTIDPTRRLALVTLSMLYRDLEKKILEDREFAVGVAAIAEGLDHTIGRFKEMADLITSAQARIRIALCARADTLDVLKEAQEHMCTESRLLADLEQKYPGEVASALAGHKPVTH